MANPSTHDRAIPAKSRADSWCSSPAPILSTAPLRKIAVLLLLPISAYAQMWMILVPLIHYYNWLSELGMLCVLICTDVLSGFCCGAVWAYLARKYRQAPALCHFAGSPFLAIYILYSAATRTPLSFTGGGIAGALLVSALSVQAPAVYFARILAFPQLHSSDFNEGTPPGGWGI